MSQHTRRLIAGNWKMNGLSAAIPDTRALSDALKAEPARCAVVICPPATLIHELHQSLLGGPISVGAQNCHIGESGAHTGDISASMLADAGATHVIVGHSERRADHFETDGMVRQKARAALDAGLVPIICVGETAIERNTGLALTVVEQQLVGSVPAVNPGEAIVIAYEPVWAIGTGLVPTATDIAQMHGSIRAWLAGRDNPDAETIPILYGGSLKAANAVEILGISNVDGGLVGGASLVRADFEAIIRAA